MNIDLATHRLDCNFAQFLLKSLLKTLLDFVDPEAVSDEDAAAEDMPSDSSVASMSYNGRNSTGCSTSPERICNHHK